ncbi:MAG: hypothetical protein ACK5PP_08460 [Acidimicrobiales bacterium]
MSDDTINLSDDEAGTNRAVNEPVAVDPDQTGPVAMPAENEPASIRYPPPGWYYAQGDPPDTARYWDGDGWVTDALPRGG